MADLRFGLLGPFDVRVDGNPIAITGAAERGLLALLLLSAGRSVPATSLIDRLWAESALPLDPMNALQIRVSKLRRALAAKGLEVVHRDGVGYRADVAPEAIDTELFVSRVRRVRSEVAAAGEHPTEAHLHQYDEALGLWRGAALSDFATEPWATGEAVRLEELRGAAREERARLALALGRHAEVVTDLESLVAADPTRETMAGLLMIALYRAGRQADALEVYARTRTMLDDELGLEPSASLRSLHERVLRQDGSLGAAADLTVPAPVVPRAEARRTTRGTPVSTLPAVLPALIGRDADLTAARNLLREARLVTLVGPGGAGKTTLGLHVAAQSADDFPDGVVLVRLAPVREPGQVAEAVADALGIPQDASVATLDMGKRLLDYLAGKRALLVLDNCEHLVEAVATLADDLMRQCPSVSMLATSREALAVAGEVQTLVGPLPTPPETAEPAEVPGFAAAQLLLRRVQAVRPSYDPSDVDLGAAGRICRALDGMPLALELAAARTSSMSLSEIADRLDQRFDLLTGGARTAESRQRTLRATVDWSHDLLGELEKRVFARLSVFQGGWDLTAAEAVLTDAGIDTGLDTGQVLQAMGRLVEQSLVTVEPGETTRYRMLETLREYAADRLAEAGEDVELSRRHARYFGALAEETASSLRGHGQHQSLRVLRGEYANLRAALDWLAGPHGDLDEALTMAGRLGLFWHQGRHVEGRQLLRRLLARQGGTPVARAHALQAVSLVERPRACMVHPSARCAATAQESLEVFVVAGEEAAAALSMTLLAVEGVAGLDEAAIELLDGAEARFREAGEPWGLAVVGFVRLEAALKTGDEERALELGRRTAAAFRELDDPWGLSGVLLHLGWGLRQFGRYDEAVRTLAEAVDVAAAAGVDNTVQWALADLGITLVHLDQADEAEDAFRRAERASLEVGDRAGRILATYGRGLLAESRGDWSEALDRFAEAVDGFEELGTPVMVGQAALGMARSHRGLAEAERALELYGRVLDLGTSAGEPSLVATGQEGLAVLAAGRGELAEARRHLALAEETRAAAHRPASPLDARDRTEAMRLVG